MDIWKMAGLRPVDNYWVNPMGKMFFNIPATSLNLKSTSCGCAPVKAWPWPASKGNCGENNPSSRTDSPGTAWNASRDEGGAGEAVRPDP